MTDPWIERMGEYLDNDLKGLELQDCNTHVKGCEACQDELAALKDLRSSTRALPNLDPPRDLWPVVAARIETPKRRFRRVAEIAATVLLAFTLGWWAHPTLESSSVSSPSSEEQFILLLHASLDVPGQPVENKDALVARYRAWAQGIARDGKLIAGEKLARAEGEILDGTGGEAPKASGVIGGFFILQAANYDEAVKIAKTCPHLEQGWIEVRRIQRT